jgi:hypothetical protein
MKAVVESIGKWEAASASGSMSWCSRRPRANPFTARRLLQFMGGTMATVLVITNNFDATVKELILPAALPGGA